MKNPVDATCILCNIAGMTELDIRMTEQNLTSAELARRVGRHRSSISRLRNGLTCHLKYEDAQKISRITGVAVEALLASTANSQVTK